MDTLLTWDTLATPELEEVDTPISGLSVYQGKTTLSVRTGVILVDGEKQEVDHANNDSQQVDIDAEYTENLRDSHNALVKTTSELQVSVAEYFIDLDYRVSLIELGL